MPKFIKAKSDKEVRELIHPIAAHRIEKVLGGYLVFWNNEAKEHAKWMQQKNK